MARHIDYTLLHPPSTNSSPSTPQVGGWGLAFYAFAALAALWAVPWLQMHQDLTKLHSAAPSASPKAATPAITTPTAAAVAGAAAAAEKDPNVGFWPLMRRKEVWAIAVAQYASSFGLYGLLAWLPSFFLEHCGLQLSQVRWRGGHVCAHFCVCVWLCVSVCVYVCACTSCVFVHMSASVFEIVCVCVLH